MHFFYVEGLNLEDEETRLSEEDINHAYRVLRLKPGDEVVVSDGLGEARKGRIATSFPQSVSVILGDRINFSESPLKITLFQSLLKGEKMDLVVRQAVELGVYRIIPVITRRSIPQREKKQDLRRLLRWRSKVRSASAQCRRAFLAKVEDVEKLGSVLPRIGNCKTLVPWEGEEAFSLSEILKQPCPTDRAVCLFIGPEGGFEQDEIEALIKAGADIVHLGPRILRSETAAAVAVTMVQAAWGDISGKGASI